MIAATNPKKTSDEKKNMIVLIEMVFSIITIIRIKSRIKQIIKKALDLALIFYFSG